MKNPGFSFQSIKYPLVATIGFMVILELILFVFFRYYELNTVVPCFLETERTYYRAKRKIIQFMPECAVYDPGLAYILKTGTCEFSNIEFSTRYRINSMGVRDDEASLEQPEIIVLGDSYAMGWGVEQDESFSEVLEETIPAKVLNAGISSYGTARELLMLRRMNKSRLRYVIVQYYFNDEPENWAFLDNNNELEISGPEVYQEVVDYSSGKSGYRPFDFDVKLLETMSKAIRGVFSKKVKSDRSVELRRLVEVLAVMQREINGARIILFEVQKYKNSTTDFYGLVEQIVSEKQFSGLKKQLTLLNVQEKLTDSDFFLLDGHLNRQGQRKLADMIRATVL